jgi:hypothetical protein
MNAKTLIFLIGLIGIVGSSAAIVNSIFPENSAALIGIVILSASMSLFIALLVETMTQNLASAIIDKNLENQTSLLSAVIGKAIYNVLKDEKKKE